jgi:hypothetical protein
MRTRAETAGELAGLLEAAWDGFGAVVASCRECQERAGGLFAAFAYAAAAAAQGQLALATAPSLGAGHGGGTGRGGPVPSDPGDLERTADGLAGLAGLLAARLAEAARQASDPGDSDACAQAGAAAAQVRELLARDGPWPR